MEPALPIDRVIEEFLLESSERVAKTGRIIREVSRRVPDISFYRFRKAILHLQEVGRAFQVSRGRYIHSSRLREDDIPNILVYNDPRLASSSFQNVCLHLARLTRRPVPVAASFEPIQEFAELRMAPEGVYHVEETRRSWEVIERELSTALERFPDITGEPRLEDLDTYAQWLIDVLRKAIRRVEEARADLREWGRRHEVDTLEDRATYFYSSIFQPLGERNVLLVDTNALINLLIHSQVIPAVTEKHELVLTDEIATEFRRVVRRAYSHLSGELEEQFGTLIERKLMRLRWDYPDPEKLRIGENLDGGERTLLSLLTKLIAEGEHDTFSLLTCESGPGLTEISRVAGELGCHVFPGLWPLLTNLSKTCSLEVGQLEEVALSVISQDKGMTTEELQQYQRVSLRTTKQAKMQGRQVSH